MSLLDIFSYVVWAVSYSVIVFVLVLVSRL